MVLAVGTGAYVAAIFLMICHAFYKALLFLGSGSVIHGLHGEQDIDRMGALRKFMPITFATFLIGWLAIAGVPPFASFWSKGDVLDSVYRHYPALWVLGIITAILTAYYMSRLFFLVFTGKARFDEPAADGRPAIHDPHESPKVMTIPLVVLAVGTLLVAGIDLPWMHAHTLKTFLEPVFTTNLYDPNESSGLQVILAAVDAIMAVIGIAVAWVAWRNGPDRPLLEPKFLANVWYWDNFYDAIIGRPGQRLAQEAARADVAVIDGAVMGAAAVVTKRAQALRRIQTGQVRQYALFIAAGLVAILVFLLVKAFHP